MPAACIAAGSARHNGAVRSDVHQVRVSEAFSVVQYRNDFRRDAKQRERDALFLHRRVLGRLRELLYGRRPSRPGPRPRRGTPAKAGAVSDGPHAGPRLARSAASTRGDTFIAADHALSGKSGQGTQKCFATESETAKAARAVARRRFLAQVGFRRQTYAWMRWSYNASAFVLLTMRSILPRRNLRWALDCCGKSVGYLRYSGEERRYGARLSSPTMRHMAPTLTGSSTPGRK